MFSEGVSAGTTGDVLVPWVSPLAPLLLPVLLRVAPTLHQVGLVPVRWPLFSSSLPSIWLQWKTQQIIYRAIFSYMVQHRVITYFFVWALQCNMTHFITRITLVTAHVPSSAIKWFRVRQGKSQQLKCIDYYLNKYIGKCTQLQGLGHWDSQLYGALPVYMHSIPKVVLWEIKHKLHTFLHLGLCYKRTSDTAII